MAEAEDRSPRSRIRGLMVAVVAWKKMKLKYIFWDNVVSAFTFAQCAGVISFEMNFIRTKYNCEFRYWVPEKNYFGQSHTFSSKLKNVRSNLFEVAAFGLVKLSRNFLWVGSLFLGGNVWCVLGTSWK